MAKSKELKEIMKEVACATIFNTNYPNTKVVLYKTKLQSLYAIVKEEKDSVSVSLPEDSKPFKASLLKIVDAIHPGFLAKKINEAEVIEEFPDYLEILSDENGLFLDNGYKILLKEDIDFFLAGKKHSDYKYTSTITGIKILFKRKFLPKGYENYPKEILDRMEDVSMYKAWHMTCPEAYKKLESGIKTAIIAEGDPGTGKTVDALIWAAQNEVPIVVDQICQGTQKEDVISSFIPDTEHENLYKLTYGPLVYAMLYGGICLINEANYETVINSMLNSILDGTKMFKLADNSIHKINDNFRLVLTINAGFDNTYPISLPVIDRIINVAYSSLNKPQILQRLEDKYSINSKESWVNTLVDSYLNIKETYFNSGYKFVPQYRKVEEFVETLACKIEDNALAKKDIQELFTSTFVNPLRTTCDIDHSEAQYSYATNILKSYIDSFYIEIQKIYFPDKVKDDEDSSEEETSTSYVEDFASTVKGVTI